MVNSNPQKRLIDVSERSQLPPQLANRPGSQAINGTVHQVTGGDMYRGLPVHNLFNLGRLTSPHA